MAIFGVFGRKEKQRHNATDAKPSPGGASDLDANSFTTEYSSSPGKANTVYSGPSGASSSKLMLGLRRKKSPQASPAPDPADNKYLRPPATGYFSSARSEPGHDIIEPPPRKSSLFSAFDPGARSTRSLPSQAIDLNASRSPSRLDTNTDTNTSPTEKKSKGIFSWAHHKKPKPSPSPSPVEDSVDSFNLRSFRHIKAESPSADLAHSPPNLSPDSLVPPARPRPRGSSVASESSRISVAAFREMAAKRSAANSPVQPLGDPLRPPSTLTLSTSPIVPRHSTMLPSDSSESSESEEEDDEDSAGSSTLRPRRQNTIRGHTPGKGKGKSKATSELGHRPHPSATPAKLPVSASADLSRGESLYARPRASASTSALQPNAAAKRASLLVANKVGAKPAPARIMQTTRPTMTDPGNSSSSSDSSEDSDDAPLSRLVGPRRPGSSASTQTSGSRSRVPSKPLIDISGIAKLPPLFATNMDRAPTLPEKDTPSPIALSKPSINDRLTRLAQSSASRSSDSLQKLPSSPQEDDKPLRKGPTRSQTEPPEKLLQSSPASPRSKPNGRSLSSPNAMAGVFEEVKDLSDPKPIVPTPIRERSPPPAFSVTSRPPSQLSLSSHTQAWGATSSSPTQQSPTIRMVGAPEPSSASSTSTFETRSSASSRPRASTTLVTAGGLDTSKGFTGGGLLASNAASPRDAKASPRPSPKPSPQPSPTVRPRQRASTTVGAVLSDHAQPQVKAPSLPTLPFANSQSSFAGSLQVPAHDSSTSLKQSAASQGLKSALVPRQRGMTAPQRPFAAAPGVRGYSPASSTEDSSSGRTPITPGEGSDISYGHGESAEKGKGAVSRDVKRTHRKSASVTFDAPEKERGRAGPTSAGTSSDEARRRERRRSEAKAAIELGNVVNSRKPLANDDDDGEDIPGENMPPRMSMLNPMMGMGGMVNVIPPSPMAWQQAPAQFAPQPFMMMPQAQDPAFLAAAHQHAMLAAKHAYQMAVAQQAMAAASEEWERGSTAGSTFGVGTMYPPAQGGYGLGVGMGWPGVMFPSSSQSMYAGSTAGSELGWGGSRSVYGEPSYGGGGDRASMYRGSQMGGVMQGGARPSPRPRTKTAPSDSSVPQQQRGRGAPPPPTSWRAGGPRHS